MVPEMTQPHLQQPVSQISPRDEQLHKDLDDQIQLVKQIQTILGTEMMKLEIMRKHVKAENIDRKEIIENPTSQPKRLRVCCPSSINKGCRHIFRRLRNKLAWMFGLIIRVFAGIIFWSRDIHYVANNIPQ
jgi:hypothetical protein